MLAPRKQVSEFHYNIVGHEWERNVVLCLVSFLLQIDTYLEHDFPFPQLADGINLRGGRNKALFVCLFAKEIVECESSFPTIIFVINLCVGKQGERYGVVAAMLTFGVSLYVPFLHVSANSKRM